MMRNNRHRLALGVAALAFAGSGALSGCGQLITRTNDLADWFTVTSPAFRDGSELPARFACTAYPGGQGKTPPLRWSNPGGGTQAYAIVVDDPDDSRNESVHWVMYNIDGNAIELVEGTRLEKTWVEGLNSSKKVGYAPPCPRKGERHRYRFTIYALSQRVDLKRGADLKNSLSTIAKYTVGRGRITGNLGGR